MYDVALSAMSLVVEAEHQRLRAHQMAGFKEETFRRVLKIPENEIPAVIIAIGYEGTVEDLEPIVREKEMTRQRVRKPMNEVVTVVEKIA